MSNLKVLQKIFDSRQHIKGMNLKKLGHNDYSHYDYYTPEQINKLVNDACEKFKLFNKYSLNRTDLGLVAELTVLDLESGESETFRIATEIPEIKATNIAQQLGGAVTYSERYLHMIAYDIKDNNLDFDSQDNTKSTNKAAGEDNRPWLTATQFNSSIERIRRNDPGESDTIEDFVEKIKKEFKMKKIYREQLDDELKSGFNQALNK